jgi:hypothetical protein
VPGTRHPAAPNTAALGSCTAAGTDAVPSGDPHAVARTSSSVGFTDGNLHPARRLAELHIVSLIAYDRRVVRVRELLCILALSGCDQAFGLQDRDATVSSVDSSLPRGLLRWYTMDALEGNRLVDATGHGHHALCPLGACPSATIGVIDGALAFDGTMQFAQSASDADLDSIGDFTVAMWTYIERPTGNYQCVVSKVLGEAAANSWQLCLDATGHWGFLTSSGNLVIAEPAPLGQWHHVAIRWNGSTLMMAISLDAVDRGSQPGLVTNDNGGLAIAGDLDSGQPDALFAGSLDDLRIYGRVLTDAELIELATAPRRSSLDRGDDDREHVALAEELSNRVVRPR